MKISHVVPALAAILLTSVTVQADEVPASPVTVSLAYARAPGSTFVWSPATVAETISARFAANLGDGNGWTGLGKAKVKLAAACSAPRTFKGVSAAGLTWKRTNMSNPETYTATITTVRCE